MFMCMSFVRVVSNFLILFQCSAGPVFGRNVLRFIHRVKISALLPRLCLSVERPFIFRSKAIVLHSSFVRTVFFAERKIDMCINAWGWVKPTQHADSGRCPAMSNLVLCRGSGITPASLLACPWSVPVRLPFKRWHGCSHLRHHRRDHHHRHHRHWAEEEDMEAETLKLLRRGMAI